MHAWLSSLPRLRYRYAIRHPSIHCASGSIVPSRYYIELFCHSLVVYCLSKRIRFDSLVLCQYIFYTYNNTTDESPYFVSFHFHNMDKTIVAFYILLGNLKRASSFKYISRQLLVVVPYDWTKLPYRLAKCPKCERDFAYSERSSRSAKP